MGLSLILPLLSRGFSMLLSLMVSYITSNLLQALKAAVHNYPMVVLSFWDEIYGIVVEVVDTGWERTHASSASPAKGVLSAGYAQPSRICDDKLVQSAIKVC